MVKKNLPANTEDSRGFYPWVGKISWRGNGNPLQYSCLENFTDRGAWWATVHGVDKELDKTEHAHIHMHTHTHTHTRISKI